MSNIYNTLAKLQEEGLLADGVYLDLTDWGQTLIRKHGTDLRLAFDDDPRIDERMPAIPDDVLIGKVQDAIDNGRLVIAGPISQ